MALGGPQGFPSWLCLQSQTLLRLEAPVPGGPWLEGPLRKGFSGALSSLDLGRKKQAHPRGEESLEKHSNGDTQVLGLQRECDSQALRQRLLLRAGSTEGPQTESLPPLTRRDRREPTKDRLGRTVPVELEAPGRRSRSSWDRGCGAPLVEGALRAGGHREGRSQLSAQRVPPSAAPSPRRAPASSGLTPAARGHRGGRGRRAGGPTLPGRWAPPPALPGAASGALAPGPDSRRLAGEVCGYFLSFFFLSLCSPIGTKRN